MAGRGRVGSASGGASLPSRRMNIEPLNVLVLSFQGFRHAVASAGPTRGTTAVARVEEAALPGVVAVVSSLTGAFRGQAHGACFTGSTLC